MSETQIIKLVFGIFIRGFRRFVADCLQAVLQISDTGKKV